MGRGSVVVGLRFNECGLQQVLSRFLSARIETKSWLRAPALARLSGTAMRYIAVGTYWQAANRGRDQVERQQRGR